MIMENLNYNELININGGTECHPIVSSDTDVQAGYSLGWHVGHAIGEAIDMLGSVIDTVNPFGWFD